MSKKVIDFVKDETEHEICDGCNRRMTEKWCEVKLPSGREVILCNYCYELAKDGSEALKEKIRKDRARNESRYKAGAMSTAQERAYKRHIEKHQIR